MMSLGKKVIILIVFLTLFLSLRPLCWERIKRAKDPARLILISFDGFRWDYLENNTLPLMNYYFVRNGVKIRGGLKNAFTTVTFPNHWTLATGLYPSSHGIVANVMYDHVLNETFYDFGKNDNDTRWFGQNEHAVPIWILNQMQGNGQSGIIGGFPGANVPIRDITVRYSEDYANKYDWKTKIDRLIDLFIRADDPINFGVLYFPEPDETGHTYGPYSIQIKLLLEEIDQTVGYLIQKLVDNGLFDTTNVIITSDHGMDSASFENSIDLSDYVDTSKFKMYGGLTQVNIFPNKPEDLEEIYSKLSHIPHYNIYKKEQVPDRLVYRDNVRIGPLVMFGDVGFELFKTGRKKFDWANWKGDHGGDNQVSSMHPVFVATGPAFKKNLIIDDTVDSVDLYPVMCLILGLDPVGNNGSLERLMPALDLKHSVRDLKELEESYQRSTQMEQMSFMALLVLVVLILEIVINKLQKFDK